MSERPNNQPAAESSDMDGVLPPLLSKHRRYALMLAGYPKAFWVLTVIALLPFFGGILAFMLWTPAPQFLVMAVAAPLVAYLLTMRFRFSEADLTTTPAVAMKARTFFTVELLLSACVLIWLAVSIQPRGVQLPDEEKISLITRDVESVEEGKLYLLKWSAASSLQINGKEASQAVREQVPEAHMLALSLPREEGQPQVFSVMDAEGMTAIVTPKEGAFEAAEVLFELNWSGFLAGANLTEFARMLEPAEPTVKKNFEELAIDVPEDVKMPDANKTGKIKIGDEKAQVPTKPGADNQPDEGAQPSGDNQPEESAADGE